MALARPPRGEDGVGAGAAWEVLTFDWTQRLNAIWKFLLSFRKRTWDLSDYPVRVRHVDAVPDRRGAPAYAWSADIVRWWAMAGFGHSRSEALHNLARCFEQRASRPDPLPRPGTPGPVEFASTRRIEQHADLAADFLQRVLGLRREECFISDQSSLWDFHDQETNEHLNGRIVELYGVDVLDMESALLADIFDRIAEKSRVV